MAAGRFAPSPSGPLHLGSLRTALVAWLFARSAGSRFVLRIDDLDAASARAEHERSQIRDLEALGLDWDGPVLHQHDRLDRYAGAIDELVAGGLVYPCFCTRREIAEATVAPHEHLPDGAYPGTCRDLSADERRARAEATGRPPALRIRAGGVVVGFDDDLVGPYEGVVDDFVISRFDGTPAYNLAVVIDDADQRIEQVVRGGDLLAGTPRQIFLARLLGLPVPCHAHVPLVLGADGVRLAKRHGSVTLGDLEADGVAPAEVRSLLATTLGMAEPGELVAMRDLVDRFDPGALPREPFVVDEIVSGCGGSGGRAWPGAC